MTGPMYPVTLAWARIMYPATVAGTVPARAVDLTRALPSDPLATATVAANSYVAWDLHVPEAGPSTS